MPRRPDIVRRADPAGQDPAFDTFCAYRRVHPRQAFSSGHAFAHTVEVHVDDGMSARQTFGRGQLAEQPLVTVVDREPVATLDVGLRGPHAIADKTLRGKDRINPKRWPLPRRIHMQATVGLCTGQRLQHLHLGRSVRERIQIGNVYRAKRVTHA